MDGKVSTLKRRKERKERAGKPRQRVKEEGGRVCCVNLDVKKNETTEQDPPVLALALMCRRPGQGPPEVAGIKVPVSTRPDSPRGGGGRGEGL